MPAEKKIVVILVEFEDALVVVQRLMGRPAPLSILDKARQAWDTEFAVLATENSPMAGVEALRHFISTRLEWHDFVDREREEALQLMRHSESLEARRNALRDRVL
jgi:hypothetical protein